MAREPSSFMGADEFSFRHVLIRDVAYESLPKLDRADKHLAVVRWAEHELGERSTEEAELIASHVLAALRYREEFAAPEDELRELRQKAYEAVIRARDRAGLLHEKGTVTRWARIAVELGRSLRLDAVEQARAAAAFLAFGAGNWQRDEAVDIAQAGHRAVGRHRPRRPSRLTRSRPRSAAAWRGVFWAWAEPTKPAPFCTSNLLAWRQGRRARFALGCSLASVGLRGESDRRRTADHFWNVRWRRRARRVRGWPRHGHSTTWASWKGR